jgi:uncharacterized membrane protein (Fun14 family)
MNSESLVPVLTSMGSGFFIGILVGFFIKKIIRILMFLVGGIVGLLLYLQQQQIISVNLDKLEQSSTFIYTSMLSSFDNVTQIGDTSSLGIPLVGGLSAGLAIGLTKG